MPSFHVICFYRIHLGNISWISNNPTADTSSVTDISIPQVKETREAYSQLSFANEKS